jgi:sugar lactone lactonase YvrE
VYVADGYNNRVMKWPQGSTTGTVVGPQLGYGTGPDTNHMDTATCVCLDSTESNLYISDTGNCRILKWNIASDDITIVAGGNGCGDALNQIHQCDGLYSDR